ncbi:hypothetical protein GCM10010371_61540 [Streptomyces subrutilus]|uniref:DUF4232 domain-containing protein n=2 Tax=Streptomyces subrutilus TaxID=36818 RepID=A0A5P2UR21_9ACTN|nr:DUF4232 domain-containing protein [Streptomyces subrutilus]GGZ93396.1 hypothetical protein GCM10010371_61540 [Streptomyces subrutilus]
MVMSARTAIPALLSLAVGAALVASVPAVASGPAGERTCASGELDVSVGEPDAGAGQLYLPLHFTNTGDRPCTLRGFPGVSVLDGARRQIGEPADRDGGAPGAVSLAPGRSATATLRTTNGPLGGACLPEGAFLKVYPPASTDAFLLKTPFKVCSDRFTVSATG